MKSDISPTRTDVCTAFRMGDVLRAPVFSRAGAGGAAVLLLAAGQRIETVQQLEQLRRAGFAVHLPREEQAARAAAPANDLLSGDAPRGAGEASRVRRKVATAARDVTERLAREGASSAIPLLRRASEEVAEHVIADPYAAACMSYLGDCDEYTVTHCADVAILMAAIGALLGLPEEELALLAWAGMVHDVGKQRISREVLEKPGRLTPAERTEVRRHPELGVEILRAAPECPASVLSVILQHHERLNGSGYPYGLSCEELHPHSRIAAVADTFDAMTAERVYKPPTPAREVLVYLACESDRCFDRNATTALAKLIGVYPIGTRVVLSTGERGVVVAPNPEDSLRPSIRIDADRNGRRLVQPFILDLRGAVSYIAGLVA